MNHANDGTHSPAEIQKHADAYSKLNPGSQTARDARDMRESGVTTPSPKQGTTKQQETQQDQDRMIYDDKGQVVGKRTPEQQQSHDDWVNGQIEWAKQHGW